MRYFIIFLCFIGALYSKVLDPKDAFKISYSSDEKNIYINYDLAPNIFLYKKELKILINSINISDDIKLPKPSIKDNIEVFYDLDFNIENKYLKSKNIQRAKLEILYQGCSDEGFCYRPMKLELDIDLKNDIYELSPFEAKNHMQNILENDSFYVILAVFFAYGLLLALSPCVLPMVPILSTLILNKINNKASKKNIIFYSITYILAMSVAYAIAGLVTSYFGMSLQGFLQRPWVLIICAGIFVLLALNCFGLFNIQFSSKVQNTINTYIARYDGYWGVIIMGFLSSLIIAPCMVAPLSAVLLYIANTQDLIMGASTLFVLGLGMGVPLMLLAFGFSFIKPGRWMDKINQIFGFIMLGMGIWILGRFIDAFLIRLLYILLVISFVFFMGLFKKEKIKKITIIKKILLAFILIFSIYLYINQSSNLTNFKQIKTLEELEYKIAKNDKPILVEFSATWCANCKIIEKTLNEKILQEKLKNYELIQIDISTNNDEELKIMKKYHIFAPPVILIIKDQKIKHQITGLINANELLKYL